MAVAGLPLLYFLHFDFNPINLRSPKVESIATFLDLRKDPNTGANAINVMAPSVEAAREIEAKLAKVPEVQRTMSLETFVPADQDAKLKLIHDGAKVLGPALNPESIDPAPTDEENVAALQSTEASLRRVAGDAQGPGGPGLPAAGGCDRQAGQIRSGDA